MHTVSLFLYKFHFEIVAFFLRVRNRMKTYSADCFFLLRFSVMPVFSRSNSSKYLYVSVRALLLIGFQFMSPGCCNASSYYSWSSSPLVAYYCSFSNVVFFDETDHPLRIWPIIPYTHNTLLPSEQRKGSLIQRSANIFEPHGLLLAESGKTKDSIVSCCSYKWKHSKIRTNQLPVVFSRQICNAHTVTLTRRPMIWLYLHWTEQIAIAFFKIWNVESCIKWFIGKIRS